MKRDADAPRGQADAAGHRHQRLEVSVREELQSILRDDVTDPELEGVMVSAVVLSPDYRNARVHFMVPRGRPRTAVERAFGRAAPFLRARLAEAVELKRTPELRFVYEAEIGPL
jgi:ribosome-binding factor A